MGVQFGNQSYLISVWVVDRREGRAAERVVGFVGEVAVSCVHPRISRPDAARGVPAALAIALPRNLVEDGRLPIRLFAIFAGRRAAEVTLSKAQLAMLHRGPS